MLNGLYYLFNNGLDLNAYIAIEAISAKADEELLTDVMLVILCSSDYIFGVLFVNIFFKYIRIIRVFLKF